ncbi:MAG: winged helix-turn-helix domain-containing protein [Gemmatimonadaceae bacterium]
MSSSTLHPHDVAVALHLLNDSSLAFPEMAADLGMSLSTAHASVKRLVLSGLVRESLGTDRRSRERMVNRRAMLEFLEHGVKYAFAGTLGASGRGVPTAHAGPALSDLIVSDESVVWPDAAGDAFGPTLEPLLPGAARLKGNHPETYALLSAVDAIRVGRARERKLAIGYLRDRLMHDVSGVA